MLLSDPVLQRLNRGPESEGRVLPCPVAENLDVFEGGSLDLGVSGIVKPMHPLVLEAVEAALCRRVIPSVAFPAHRASQAERVELVLKRVTCVLVAPIRVVQKPRCRSFPEPRHGQRIGHNVRRPGLIRRRRRELPGGQVLGHRQVVLRVCRDRVAPLVAGMDAVVAHHLFAPFLAGRERSCAQFAHYPRAAVRTSEFGMDCPYERQHLVIGKPLAIGLTATFPGPIATDTDVKQFAHFAQQKGLALLSNPSVLHRISLAKYAVAVFWFFFSRLSRRFSARSINNFISSGVSTWLPAPFSLSSAAALTQLRTVWSLSPSSLQTMPTLCPSLIRLTASSLNSTVYACFGIFSSCLPKSGVHSRSPLADEISGEAH